VVEADAVVLAGGAGESARIVEGLDEDLASVLRGIPSAPLAVVCLGYEETRLPRPLDGFGFLIPRGQGPRILGVLWDSSVYPDRAPPGRVLLRAMIGGAHDEGALALDDPALLGVVRKDLKATMGLDADPALVRIFRHPRGIPQYTVGHLDRLARAEARLERHPGIYLAGSAYRGVAINSCVAEAGPLAGRILSRLFPD
jgi:oxygen-dependent protoporphyrinogen oxidase